jgi:integrase
MRRGGQFYRSVWVPGRGKDRRCLHTSDKREAERLGRALLATLLQGTVPAAPVQLTLGELWRRYSTECAPFRAASVRWRAEAETKADVLLSYFGSDCKVRDLVPDDQTAYTIARRAGGIRIDDTHVTRAVRARAVESDLAHLHRMLNWAVTVRAQGVRLLDANPLAGTKRVHETSPRRPMTTWERFTKTRAAMRDFAVAAADDDLARVRWLKMEFALVLAEATGRRLGSIRQLHWQDIDLERATIHWRAEADKKGQDWDIPIPAALVEEIRGFRRALAAVGGLCFPAEQDPTAPMDRKQFDKWLRRAETEAEVPKLLGGLWHPYRRKWATERKHLPIVDVAAAGGWRDKATLLECYTQPTNDALLAVMSEERKVRDVAVASGRT